MERSEKAGRAHREKPFRKSVRPRPESRGLPVRRNRPTGRHVSHLGAILRHAVRRNRSTDRHFSHLGFILRYTVRRNRPTGRHFSHLGFILRHPAFQRSERAVKKRASQPQTTKHLEKTTKHLVYTNKPTCISIVCIRKHQYLYREVEQGISCRPTGEERGERRPACADVRPRHGKIFPACNKRGL